MTLEFHILNGISHPQPSFISASKFPNMRSISKTLASMAHFKYDSAADALYITIRGTDITCTKQLTNDVILDHDKHGKVVGIEILNVRGNLRKAIKG